MKTILLTICLSFFYVMASAQLYYGASVGVQISKSWDGKTKQIRNGINDIYLSVPVGFTTHNILFEIAPQITAQLSTSIYGSVGYKIDFSDNAGIHLLAGYTDQIYYTGKPISLTHYFYPSGIIRLWLGNGMIQGSYFNKQYYVGIGVIGFWGNYIHV